MTRLGLNQRFAARLLAATGCLAPVCFSAAVASAQNAERVCSVECDPRYADLRMRAQCIAEELTELGQHDWAGRYSCGIAASITITPQNGFVAVKNVALQDIAPLAQGALVDAHERALRLAIVDSSGEPVSEASYANMGRIAADMTVVAWSEYRFLVPTDDLIRFCNSSTGGLALELEYYLRDSDPISESTEIPFLKFNRRLPPGSPAVPAEFRGYLRLQPIQASVIEAGPTKAVRRAEPPFWLERSTRVKLDAGRSAGLLPGMWLFVPERVLPVLATIESATQDESIANVRCLDRPAATCDPQCGDCFTTRPFTETYDQSESRRRMDLQLVLNPLLRSGRTSPSAAE